MRFLGFIGPGSAKTDLRVSGLVGRVPMEAEKK